jgi:hypothetical protein
MKTKPSTGVYLSIILCAILFLIEPLGWVSEGVLWAIMGFVVTFGIITWFFSKAMMNAKNGKVWINQFLASIAIKMFATLSYLTIFLYMNKDWATAQKLQLAIGAFFIYIAYTILLANTKPNAE